MACDGTAFPFEVHDLRELNEPRLIQAFHRFMTGFFPIPDEMDPCEVWLENMVPDASQAVPMFGLAIFDPSAPADPQLADCPVHGQLIAGALFEYYKLSNSALLSYICVDEKYKSRGVARKLIELMFACLQKEAAKYQPASIRSTEPVGDAREAALGRISRLSPSEVDGEVWSHALACLSVGDVAWAQESDQHVPLFAIFAETNALGVDDGVMEASVRHNILHKLGFRLLDFDYVQPPLSEGQAPCYDLLLLALENPLVPAEVNAANCPGDGARHAIPRWQLQLFMFDYALSTHLCCDFKEETYWKYMMASIPSSMPLQALPWTRRSVCPQGCTR